MSSIGSMNVRSGRLSDLPWILQMMRQESNSVGFIPRSKIEWGLARGRVVIAAAGRLRLGYTYIGSTTSGVLPIFQAITEVGVRRAAIGRAMMAECESLATLGQCWAMQARCRDDLASNAFWRAMSFAVDEVVEGGAGRGRRINIYGRRILESGRSHSTILT